MPGVLLLAVVLAVERASRSEEQRALRAARSASARPDYVWQLGYRSYTRVPDLNFYLASGRVGEILQHRACWAVLLTIIQIF